MKTAPQAMTLALRQPPAQPQAGGLRPAAPSGALSGAAADFLCAFPAALGLVGWTAGMLGLDGSLALLAAAVAVTTMLLCTLGLLPGRAKLVGWGSVAVLALALTALAWSPLLNGFYLTANQVLNTLTALTGRIYGRFAVGAAASQALFLCLVCAPLCGLCFYLAHSGGHVLYALLVALAATGMVVSDAQTQLVWPALAALGWLLLFLRVQWRAAAPPLTQKATLAALCLVLVAALLLGAPALPLAASTGGILGPVRNGAAALADTLRYGTTTDKLPEGDLTSLTRLELTDEPALEVVMSTPESLYLKGFVGGNFADNQWSSSLTGQADYDSTFYWLHQAGFYGQAQLAQVARTVATHTSELEAIQMTVSHLSVSRKYSYAPYELLADEDAPLDPDRIGDVDTRAGGLSGSGSYRYTSLSNQVKLYPDLLNRLYEAELAGFDGVEGYLVNESHYNAFVYEQYLDLPDDDSGYLEGLFGPYDTGGEPHMPYQATKQVVLDTLTSRLGYSEAVPALHANSQFLPWLFDEAQAGWSIHFASAAALMFRYFGSPSRYVEGYLITPSDAVDVAANSAILLNGTRAHAWCEIYHDALGWVPFEATPPYLTVMEQPDLLESYDVGQQGGGLAPDGEGTRMEDNYEEPVPPMPIPQLVQRLPIFLLVFLGLLLVLLAAAAAVRLYQKQRALKLLKVTFVQSDNAGAIRSLYLYSLRLMAALGLGRPDTYYGDVVDFTQKNIRYAAFGRIAQLYREARYSHHVMPNEAAAEVRAFKDSLLHDLAQQNNFLKRAWLRFVKGLY